MSEESILEIKNVINNNNLELPQNDDYQSINQKFQPLNDAVILFKTKNKEEVSDLKMQLEDQNFHHLN